jgi:phenylalanyl-tRNA synthetase beta chain
VKEEIIAPEELRLAALREQLAGWGLTEVMNMTFDNPADVEMANLPDEYRRMVMLDNPLSENQAAMRTTLLTGLLRTASLNHRHGRQDLRVFEAGPVYGPAEGQTLPDQFTRLGAAVSGKGERKHWSEPEHPADLYDLKGVAEAVLEEFDLLDRAAFRAESMGLFQSGESGRIELDGETVGWLGRVSEKAAKAFDLEAPLYLMEMELDPLLASAKPLPQFAAIPAFPPSLRDLAVVVSADMPAGALVDTARQYGGKYLRDVRLFDVYTGKPIPQGKKSVALNLVFQSEERTLTDKATQKAWDNIVKALQKEHGAELR